jgi:iron uptake system component EfeO
VLYTDLTPQDVKKLTTALDAFSEPVATVAGVVARA